METEKREKILYHRTGPPGGARGRRRKRRGRIRESGPI